MTAEPGFAGRASDRSEPGFISADQWVVAHRGPRAVLDPRRAYATAWEEECDAAGALAPTAVVFLTNRECPFRCVMCDLWKNTLHDRIAPGLIPQQILTALAGLPPARQIKLYNAGSFFDPGAIPGEDDQAIAQLAGGFERVIVEAHPAFLDGPYGERCLRFRDMLQAASAGNAAGACRLEVAVGLETANEDVLARLNKRMTLDSFRRAAAFLNHHDIDLRVFVLLRPPFMDEDEGVHWACRSLDVAAGCGATACTIIPTRGGNGEIETLGGVASPPSLRSLERVLEYGLSLGGMRVFADLWDAGRLFDCACSPRRAARIGDMNHRQRAAAPVTCGCDARL
jgi:radical SAM enzyme (TIGR01210 family)